MIQRRRGIENLFVSQTTVTGVERLQKIVNFLATESCWFMVDPYPDDEYCISVKVDRELSLIRAIDA